MCGRFSRENKLADLIKHFKAEMTGELDVRPRYNVSPSQMIPTVKDNEKGKRELVEMKWGYKTINARGETVDTTSMYKSAFKSRRCLIPVTGFYEWKKITEKTKQPFYIYLKDSPLFSFAGLYEYWKSPDGKEEITSCTIVTINANKFMSEIHDRMPVILDTENYDDWLSGEQGKELILPYSDTKMACYPVSTLVNTPKNDVPDCIEKVKVN